MIVYVYNYYSLKSSKKTINNIIRKLRNIYTSLICIDIINLESLKLNKVDLLIVSGGDGTINKVVNLTINYNLVYSFIPLGNANDICNNLNIKSIDKAIDLIKSYKQNNKYKYKQIMKVNNNYFLYGLAIGDISKLSIGSKNIYKKMLNKWFYIFRGIRYLFNKKTYYIKVDNKEEYIKAITVLIINTTQLGGFSVSKKLYNDKFKLIYIKNIYDFIKLFIFKNIKYKTFQNIKIYTNNLCVIDGERLELSNAMNTKIYEINNITYARKIIN